MSARWPFARTARAAGAARTSRPADQPAARPDRLLRDNPVLLLSALQAPETVSGLVAAWNPGRQPGPVLPAPAPAPALRPPESEAVPRPTRAGDAATPAPPQPDPILLTEAIRWHGPLRLTPMLRADAGLPTSGPAASLGLAYVAEVRRSRTKIVDSRHADLLRLRYPQGLPAGPEADAWHLVRGLARRLRGVARLPGGPIHIPYQDPDLPGDADHAVFGHQMLPWIVLREILRPIAPDLVREMVPDGGGYILRHRDLIEIRVGPVGPDTEWPLTRVPPVLRQCADEAWPRSVYEFSGAVHAVRSAAGLIAEVTGGIHVDSDGFPEETRTFTTG